MIIKNGPCGAKLNNKRNSSIFLPLSVVSLPSITLYLKRKHTFTISALPPPQEANMAHSQLLIIGKVMVTLLGGGFGESLIGAIISFVICN